MGAILMHTIKSLGMQRNHHMAGLPFSPCSPLLSLAARFSYLNLCQNAALIALRRSRLGPWLLTPLKSGCRRLIVIIM